MTEPKIADTRPEVLELSPGDSYWWCACGRSQTQPFCDGSHSGTDIEPIEFTVDKQRNYALCKCKRTSKSPYCDGSHSDL